MSLNKEGLSKEEARNRLLKFGPNQIFKSEEISFLSIAWEEIREPMILLLLVVGFFYSLWGKIEDALTIFVVIFLLVLVEVYNEFRAKKAIASLEKIAAPKAKVLREGEIMEIDSAEIVPGDILILVSGTKIPADAKIRQGIGLQIDESALTGESFPQLKNPGEEIYAGTVVLSGEGQAEVFATGEKTKFGQIALKLKKLKPPKTPLQLAMKSLAQKLVYVSLFFSIFIPLLGFLRGQEIKTMILTGLSLAFAIIPEELPIVITMVLGLGAYKLSQNNFLVKRIKAAETLGSATVILTDKTGTITEGRMQIVDFYPNSPKEILSKAFCALPQYTFSPIEQEIQRKALSFGLQPPSGKIIAQRDFGSGRKTKSLIRQSNGDYELFVTGAPEEIFSMCQGREDEAKENLLKQTSKGRRVIALAYKKLSPEEIKKEFSWLEKDLNFVGLIIFEDPPRKGVKETIAQVSQAGIRTVLVTGDHPLTARFIALEVGIAKKNDKVVTGEELDKLTDEELQELVKKVSVFARTTPEHKYRLVQALQKNGEIVAVTGDGINDVLALKGADIGIAMGIKGTDVAKEAAEVVLADDNFITIAQGVFEGRKFFDNLSKGVKYYLAVKTALILIFLLPVLFGLPMPFAPIQIILLELFMDLAASAGFVAEPKEKNIYLRPPKYYQKNILNRQAVGDIFLKGAFLFLAVMAVYFYAVLHKLTVSQSQTLAFSAWIFGHIFLAYISRSDEEPLFSHGILANKVINWWALLAIAFILLSFRTPLLRDYLHFSAVSLSQIFLTALWSFLLMSLLELRKKFLLANQKL